jgi:hypothetical protein
LELAAPFIAAANGETTMTDRGPKPVVQITRDHNLYGACVTAPPPSLPNAMASSVCGARIADCADGIQPYNTKLIDTLVSPRSGRLMSCLG